MIYILTGRVQSGKTAFLKKVVQELKVRKIKVSGFLSERLLVDGQTTGYDLFDVKEGKTTAFIRREGKEEWQRKGPYFFIPQGLLKAKKIILQSKKTEVLVADEVGPLELEGRGLWPALEQVIFDPSKKSLLVVRKNILKDFLKILSKREEINRLKIFDGKNKKVFDRLLEEIQRNENKS